MRPSFSARSGLSLLELLISLALLGLIGAGLSGAFGLGTQLWSRTEALNQYSQEVALRSQLRRYLSQALPPTRLTPFDVPFTGLKEGLSFVTLTETPFAPNAAALRMVLKVDQDTLLLQTELLDDENVVLDSWADTLAQNVRNLDISYFSSDENWLTEWSEDSALPQLIRIRMDDGSEPPWPDFIVRPQLQ